MYKAFPITEAELLFRRHWDTNKVRGIGASKDAIFAARHARMLDQAQQGLSAKGAARAHEDGKTLAKKGVKLVRLLCGFDDRNFDGAEYTRQGYEEAEGTGAKKIPVMKHPLVTYPVYNPAEIEREVAKYGEGAVHRWLSGGVESVRNIIEETPNGFLRRVRHFVDDGLDRARQLGGLVFVDGNFEFAVGLWYVYCQEPGTISLLSDLPERELWLPSVGERFGFRLGKDGIEVCRFDKGFEPMPKDESLSV